MKPLLCFGELLIDFLHFNTRCESGFDDRGNWCAKDKYFWVQADSFAAAALLCQHTGEGCGL